MLSDNISEAEISDKWQDFICNGTDRIAHEPDDKTLILGFRKDPL